MKMTKQQLRKIVRESIEQYRPQKSRNYNQVSPGMKSMANSAKRQFAKDYPKIKVGIDGRQGWITVDGRKAVNISSASGSPMTIEDMVDKMKKAYLGHPMNESAIYVTRGPYGTTVSDKLDMHAPDAKWISVGDMALALIEAGNLDIFVEQSPEDDEKALSIIMSKHEEGVQGGMQNWDSHVFEDYYDVDVERVLTNYATLMNHTIEDVPYEE